MSVLVGMEAALGPESLPGAPVTFPGMCVPSGLTEDALPGLALQCGTGAHHTHGAGACV